MAIQTLPDPLTRRGRGRPTAVGVLLLLSIAGGTASAQLEEVDKVLEPLIGETQFFIDSLWLRNRVNEEGSSRAVPFVFHPPQFRAKPLLVADEPWEASGIGHFSVLYDSDERKYRLYYEVENPLAGHPGYPESERLVAYAESQEGLEWTKPQLDLIPWGDHPHTNLIFGGKAEVRFPHVHIQPPRTPNGPRNLGELPQRAIRDGRFLMTYRDGRQRFAVSQDGIRWKELTQGMLQYHTETFLTLSWEPRERTFASFLTTASLYESLPGKGSDRWVARLTNPVLQGDWARRIEAGGLAWSPYPGNIESLKVFRHGDVYWGFLERSGEVELVTSRGGIGWRMHRDRPILIPAGGAATWNADRAIAPDRILEVDGEWRVYYAFAGEGERSPGGIGLATLEAERAISVRADSTGMRCYATIPTLVWPGGRLWLNADASRGSIEACVKNSKDDVIPGFAFEDSVPLQSNGHRLEVQWRNATLADLKHEEIRIELRFLNADLFAFVAAP